MKRIFILLMCCTIETAHAVSVGGGDIVIMPTSPSTTCPSGWITINEEYMSIVNADNVSPLACGAVGVADSCLDTGKLLNISSCIMYVPVGKKYRDNTGTYEYTMPCVLQ